MGALKVQSLVYMLSALLAVASVFSTAISATVVASKDTDHYCPCFDFCCRLWPQLTSGWLSSIYVECNKARAAPRWIWSSNEASTCPFCSPNWHPVPLFLLLPGTKWFAELLQNRIRCQLSLQGHIEVCTCSNAHTLDSLIFSCVIILLLTGVESVQTCLCVHVCVVPLNLHLTFRSSKLNAQPATNYVSAF